MKWSVSPTKIACNKWLSTPTPQPAAPPESTDDIRFGMIYELTNRVYRFRCQAGNPSSCLSVLSGSAIRKKTQLLEESAPSSYTCIVHMWYAETKIATFLPKDHRRITGSRTEQGVRLSILPPSAINVCRWWLLIVHYWFSAWALWRYWEGNSNLEFVLYFLGWKR